MFVFLGPETSGPPIVFNVKHVVRVTYQKERRLAAHCRCRRPFAPDWRSTRSASRGLNEWPSGSGLGCRPVTDSSSVSACSSGGR
jgi:hypothetical protein